MTLATTARARPARTRRPLDEWRQRLAADYLPLARAMARPLKARFPAAKDEFESAACMALVEAAAVFDPTRNVIFSTFAHHRIWGALRDVQRGQAAYGWRHDAANTPLRMSIYPSSEKYGRVLGIEPDDPVGWECEALDEVCYWLRKLPPRHAAACRQIYLHGKTHSETAKILGCSQSRVAFMHGEAMAMLNGSWDARVLRGAG